MNYLDKRKSQAALEFIMTYGWAIMVVIVAISALAYFGVLNPDRFLPSKCVLQSGIACMDHKAQDFGPGNGEVNVVLKNSLGYDMTSVSVTASRCTGTASQSLLTNGGQKTFTPNGCTLVSGQKYNGELNVSYTNADTGISHKMQGTITTKVE